MIPPIKTRRLLLRTPRIEDLTKYLAYRNEALSMAAQMIGPMNEKDARSFLYNQSELTDDALGWRMFSVELLGCPGLIGEVGVFVGAADPQQADVGWWLHSDYRKQGYAAEAASGLAEWCFTERGLDRITASCLSTNTASRNIMHRIGMRLERQAIKSRFINGKWQNEVGYALLKSEWLVMKEESLNGSPPPAFGDHIRSG